MLAFLGSKVGELKATPAIPVCKHVVAETEKRGTTFLREEPPFKRELASSLEAKGLNDEAIKIVTSIRYEDEKNT
jgi:hypothetical protein